MNDLNDTVLYKRHPTHKHLFCGDNGDIWSAKSSRFLGCNTSKGYKSVCINRHFVFSHRLIWETFRLPIPEKLVINHINGNKTDNRIVNLEMITNSENLSHAHKSGLHLYKKGSEKVNSKLSELDIQNILKREHETRASIARDYDVSRQTISDIFRGIKWRHVSKKDAL